MKIGIGADHGGFILKEAVISAIKSMGCDYVDFGTFNNESCDYPDYAEKVGKAFISGEIDRGILLCGTGIGIGIAANKIHGIRCAHITDAFSAAAAAEHNNANMISMGGRITTPEDAEKFVKIYLSSEFAGGRHQRRIDKITKIENNIYR